MAGPKTSSTLLLAVLWFVLAPPAAVAVMGPLVPESADSVLAWVFAAAALAAFIATSWWFWRIDPLGFSAVMVFVSIPTCVIAWAVSGDISFTELASGCIAAASVGYIAWRNLGPSEHEDALAGCEQEYDVGGVGIGWNSRQTRGDAIAFRLHNTRADPAALRVRIAHPRVFGGRVIEHVQVLDSGGSGTLELPLPALETGTHDFRIRASARRVRVFGRRLFLRPRRPFPIGPPLAMTALALAAGEFQFYGSPSVQVTLSSASHPMLAPRWTPDAPPTASRPKRLEPELSPRRARSGPA